MKKLFTLLLLTVAAFTFKSSAQTTNCSADFSFTLSGLSATFTPVITGTTANNHNYWKFGDGTVSSNLSPVHLYAAAGTYTVTHIYYRTESNYPNAVCIDSVQKKVEFHTTPLTPCNLEANFVWYAETVQLNKIHFGNLSSHFEPNDIIRWTFGDGTSSYDVNPTHIYAAAGTYTVCIRIQKNTAAGTTSCVKELCKQVVVLNECKLEANFTFEADATNKNKIYFKNTSTPAATAVVNLSWSFGDGATSTSQNPDHIYAHTGIYNVCLRISGSTTCYREICKTIEIKEPEINCNDISKFTVTRLTVNCLEFKFSPVIQNAAWKYVWSFGDLTGSTNITPSHVYPRSGNYTVFLTVYRSSTCVSTSYKIAETGTCFSCNNIWVKYEFKHESSISNTFYFHAISNYPILSQTWVITKLNIGSSTPVTLTQANPVYTFTEPGDYRVCIRAQTYGGCVKEYCEVIHITSANTACTLTSYPNPSTNQVSVALQLTSPQMIHVYIYNSLNILMKQKEQQGTTGNNIVTTNIEGLTPGWYTIKVIYGNKVCYSKFQKI